MCVIQDIKTDDSKCVFAQTRAYSTSPSLSRGGKWKKSDCPRETLLIGLSRLSLLYSFTWTDHKEGKIAAMRSPAEETQRFLKMLGQRETSSRTDSVGRCSGDVMTFPLRSNWLICLKAMMLIPSMSLLPTWERAHQSYFTVPTLNYWRKYQLCQKTCTSHTVW